MEDKFEKMDQWMMKASRAAREQKVPQKELDAFHAGVMKKIAASSGPGLGLPYPLLFAGAFSLAVISGAFFYLQHVQVSPAEDKPVKAEVKLVTEPVAPSTLVSQAEPPAPAVVLVPKVTAPVVIPQEILPAAVAVVKDEDLLEEIEALKELGVWTEEDEEEAGIPVEAAFLELENYAGETQPSVMLSPPARS